MFENFFGPKTPEQNEEILRKTAEKVFKRGVNKATIYLALQALEQKVEDLKKKNNSTPLDITNDYLLNIVRNEALMASSAIEDAMYGGANNTNQLIKEEIESLREELGEGETQH